MSSPFTHDVLGEAKREEVWLKIFPRDVALKLLACAATAFFIGLKLGVYHWFFVVLAVLIFVYGVVTSLLSIIPKSITDYQKGGGSTYANILKRKRKHRKQKAVYSLGIDGTTKSKGGA